MTIQQDASTILQSLAQVERDHQVHCAELAEATEMDPGQINDAVRILEDRGYVRVVRSMGNEPFDVNNLWIIPAGRSELERADAAASATQQESDNVENAGRPAQRQESSILLTDEQREMLVFLVEETRRSSEGRRHQFRAHRGGQNDILQSGDQRYPTNLPDLYELDATGLIRLREAETSVSFVVSPKGFAFYEEVKRAQGEPIERVEGEARHLLERDILDDFDEAAQIWRDAEDLLWSGDAEEQLTAIGHKCREALQAFAQGLYERHCPDSDALAKDKTVDRIRSVLSARRSVVGKTTEDFLIAYWGTVSDLAQRAEHGSQREDRPLLWEDGRRLVFQTLLVMVELAAATRP